MLPKFFERFDSWELVNADLAFGFTLVMLALAAMCGTLWMTGYPSAYVVANAAIALGAHGSFWCVGFIFGYPRRTTHSTGGAAQADPAVETGEVYRENTALGEVSDWMTKILLGVGLVQLTSIGEALDGFGREIAVVTDEPTAYYVTLASIAFFASSGLLCGYLWTIVRLQSALTERADKRLATMTKRVDAMSRQHEADDVAIKLVDDALSLTVEAPAHDELVAAIDACSNDAFFKLFYVASACRRDNWASPGEARRRVQRAAHVLAALAASRHGGDLYQVWGQLGYALKDQSPADLAGAQSALDRAIVLRGPVETNGHPMYEYNRAVVRVLRSGTDRPADAAVVDGVLADLRVAASDPHSRGILADTKVFTFDPWLAVNGCSYPVDVDRVDRKIGRIDSPVPLSHDALDVLALAVQHNGQRGAFVSTRDVISAMVTHLGRAGRDLRDEDRRLLELLRKYARLGVLDHAPVAALPASVPPLADDQVFSSCVTNALRELSSARFETRALNLTELFYHLARRSTGDTFKALRQRFAAVMTGRDHLPADEIDQAFVAGFEADIDRLGLDAFIRPAVRTALRAG